jgi:multiple sugar transport system ATP-binding protein
MRKGELQQVAPPQELYDSPVNAFVGGFIGSPAMNMLEARIEQDPDRLVAVIGDDRLPLDDVTLARHPALAGYAGRDVVLGLRPEDLEDAAVVDGDRRPRLRGRVQLREALGSEVLVHFTIAARQAVTEDMRELAEDVGDDRVVHQLEGGGPSVAKLVGRFSSRTGVREGDTIDVAVGEGALHFFDLQSGVAIYAS